MIDRTQGATWGRSRAFVSGCARSDALGHRGHLGLGLRERGARGQPAEHADRRPLASLERERVEPHGRPEAVVHREREPLGHDAHHRRARIPQSDAAADDARAAAEPILPDAIPDHHDGRSARRLVRRHQRPAQHGRHARHRERGRADLRAAQTARTCRRP
jgi:hypothetical protein